MTNDLTVVLKVMGMELTKEGKSFKVTTDFKNGDFPMTMYALAKATENQPNPPALGLSRCYMATVRASKYTNPKTQKPAVSLWIDSAAETDEVTYQAGKEDAHKALNDAKRVDAPAASAPATAPTTPTSVQSAKPATTPTVADPDPKQSSIVAQMSVKAGVDICVGLLYAGKLDANRMQESIQRWAHIARVIVRDVELKHSAIQSTTAGEVEQMLRLFVPREESK